MLGVDPKKIYIIAKKEFMDNIRSKWILLISIIFIILAILSAYVGSGQSDIAGQEYDVFQLTIITLMSIYVLLIPLIAIMLGFSTIAGEAEAGSLSVVLSYPVKRIEVLLGKFLGLGSVLAVTPIIGFGVSSLVIVAVFGAERALAFPALIALAIVLGLIYLSLIMCISALARTRVRAIAGGVALFFWSMIYGMVVMALYMATGGDIQAFMTGQVVYPEWLFATTVVSPGDLNSMAVMKAFGINQAMGVSVEPPGWMTMPFLLIIQLLWIIIPLFLAYYFFKKRDI
jgi:ABC-type transport system involved in multi-copper enzyme maturation permease subunit